MQALAVSEPHPYLAARSLACCPVLPTSSAGSDGVIANGLIAGTATTVLDLSDPALGSTGTLTTTVNWSLQPRP